MAIESETCHMENAEYTAEPKQPLSLQYFSTGYEVLKSLQKGAFFKKKKGIQINKKVHFRLYN